jgi:hypothetical protein
MKTQKHYLLVLVPALLMLLSNLSRATNYNYSTNIDIGSASSFVYYSQNLTSLPTFNLQTGDTLSGTIQFANGKALQYQNSDSLHVAGLGLNFTSPTLASWQFHDSVSFIGGSGNLIDGGDSSTGGQGLWIGAFRGIGTPSYGSITGFSYIITVDSISPNGVDYGGSYGGSFSVDNYGSGSFSVVSAVPEPSTYALFGLGALALVIAARRRAF